MFRVTDATRQYDAAGFGRSGLVTGLAVSALIVVLGVVVYRHEHPPVDAHIAAVGGTILVKPVSESAARFSGLGEKDIEKLQATTVTATQPPTPAPTTPPTPAHKTAAAPPSSAAPKPAPAPAPRPAITISADGCMVTATDAPGLALEAGAFTPHKGGSAHFTVPASGTLTVSSGGFQGMTSYGLLTDASGNQVAYTTSIVTVASCPPAG